MRPSQFMGASHEPKVGWLMFFFHNPIYPLTGNISGLPLREMCYEYLVLPFGISLSPRVFVNCTQSAMDPLRRQGIRITMYIGDWLIKFSTQQGAADYTKLG